jgi:hypothetical protein
MNFLFHWYMRTPHTNSSVMKRAISSKQWQENRQAPYPSHCHKHKKNYQILSWNWWNWQQHAHTPRYVFNHNCRLQQKKPFTSWSPSTVHILTKTVPHKKLDLLSIRFFFECLIEQSLANPNWAWGSETRDLFRECAFGEVVASWALTRTVTGGKNSK